jgi:hypothetical protein
MILSTYNDFWGPRGLKRIHMDISKPKKSKSVRFTHEWGFRTIWSRLAHSAPEIDLVVRDLVQCTVAARRTAAWRP